HKAIVHPGPTRCGRPPQSVRNQNAFGDRSGAPEGKPQDAQATKASQCSDMINDLRNGEATSWWGWPRRQIGGRGLTAQGSFAACGIVFDGPLLPALRGPAKEPLTFSVPDDASGLTAGGAAEASRESRRGHGGLVSAWPVA